MRFTRCSLRLLSLAALAFLPHHSLAEMSAARHALDAGQPAMAIKQLRPHLGTHPEAQFLMGRILEEGGQGVSRNSQQAISWYARAAESGYPEAFFALGRLFERGEGLPHNYREARQWYAKGAAANHVPSQLHLGLMLNEGRGGPRDITEGLAWLSVAEAAGEPAAKQILAHHRDKLDEPQQAHLARRTAELRATLPRATTNPVSTPR